ncbi:MAG: hypothetical protein ABI443_05470 [Chthoniobacterales bacterium]
MDYHFLALVIALPILILPSHTETILGKCSHTLHGRLVSLIPIPADKQWITMTALMLCCMVSVLYCPYRDLFFILRARDSVPANLRIYARICFTGYLVAVICVLVIAELFFYVFHWRFL